MRLDLKSGFFGLCLGALLMLAVGAATPPTPTPNTFGRYQVAGGAAQFVILDTQTGQSWLGDFHSTLTPPAPSDIFFQPKSQPVLRVEDRD